VAAAVVAARALGPPGLSSPDDTGASSPQGWTIPQAPPDDLVPGAVPRQTLRISHSPLGTIVIDGEGYALYRFDQGVHPIARHQTDPRVDPLPERRLLGCDGGTPAGWSPVAHSPNISHPGIDRRLLGYLERADHSRQLTIRGCPIYRYLEDRTPGQINGQARAGLWFALTPTGESANSPIQPPQSGDTPVPSSDGPS
jgi:hypothetical protein